MNSPLSGLYVHVPFCRTKCPYCDFYSVTDLGLMDTWLKAVAAEVQFYRNDFPVCDSLYLGGGTPSLLDEDRLGPLMEVLQGEIKFTPDAEVTLEANPDDLTPARLSFYRGLGVNRLSLGVQSFDESELRLLGRRHTARQAEEAVAMARQAGFANLSLDLMYALPGQTLAGWERTLQIALACRPEHLSCYQLTLEPGTALGRKYGQAGKTLFNEDAEREFFLFTSGYLEGEGYLHYEISNFARGESRVCRHNLKYWRRRRYLGLGPGAHSFDGRRRWWNHRSVVRYCELLTAGKPPMAGSELLTPEQVRLERLLLGFRMRDGVELESLAGREEDLANLASRGWLRVEGGRARPTIQGFLVADRLPLCFSD
ncbi:MAG: radical SAM family heme chaperone HemW [Deltaproteobacteria bacterium]|nr:radical SAM family heme chaperone HemW [Deltaproteobacteria bacterium]